MNENEQLLYQLGLFQPSESTKVPVTKYRPPTAEGRYNKINDMILLKVNSNEVPDNYVHEHGGHRVYHKIFPYPENVINDIKTWTEFDPQHQKYYSSFNEARARTIPILARMYDEGFKLSYNGFKQWLKKHKLKVGDTLLHPYDTKTVRHLINTIYGLSPTLGINYLNKDYDKE